MIAPKVHDNRPFLAILVCLVALAWLAIAAWSKSPHGRYLSHEAIGSLGDNVGVGYVSLALIFVGAWALMTVAMMLPTAMPLLLLFSRFIARRADAGRILAVLISGYLLTWVLFGVAAHLGDLALHVVVAQSHWLQERTWLLAASTLVTAGAYQFTPLKHLCLEKCRSPYSFIVEHWHGRSPRLEAFRLGVHHGLFCVGCCWSLMLLMFAIGAGNLGWMLALGSVMAVEKNLPWGRRLSTPLGVFLLAVGLGIMIANIGLGTACAHDGGTC